MTSADKVFHKIFISCDINDCKASNIRSFKEAKAYYESVSDADKLLIRNFAQEYSYILQCAIMSGIIEHIKYVHETLNVDLTMDSNIAFVLAWNNNNVEVCQWILNNINEININLFLLIKLIQEALIRANISMLEFAFQNFNDKLKNVILSTKFNSIDKFISTISINWIIPKFPDVKPKYSAQNNSVCIGFVFKSRLEYNANPLEEVIVNSCPVCIMEDEEKPGYILHLNHSVCKDCYNSLYDAGLNSCPLCRQPNVIC